MQSTRAVNRKEVRKVFYSDVPMLTGILPGEKISELTKYIINKFADEGLSRDEAIEILERTKNLVGEVSKIKKID